MLPYTYRPKVVVTKIGLDGHDQGSRTFASALRDFGMEVVYTTPWQSVVDVVLLAQDEDADVVGISCLAADHLLVPNLMIALNSAGMGHVRVVLAASCQPKISLT